MASDKTGKPAGVLEVEYKGGVFEVDREAAVSMALQRKLANYDRDPAAAFDAMDAILCGHLDDYIQRIPEADGAIGRYGASMTAMIDFLNAVSEQAAGAKN